MKNAFKYTPTNYANDWDSDDDEVAIKKPAVADSSALPEVLEQIISKTLKRAPGSPDLVVSANVRKINLFGYGSVLPPSYKEGQRFEATTTANFDIAAGSATSKTGVTFAVAVADEAGNKFDVNLSRIFNNVTDQNLAAQLCKKYGKKGVTLRCVAKRIGDSQLLAANIE